MTDCEADVIRALLLQPHVTGMIVGELDDQHPLVFRQCPRNLLDELFLALDVHGRKQLVLVNGLKQLFVFFFALLLGVGKRGHVPQPTFEIELRGAAIGKVEQFLRRRHDVILPRGRAGMWP